MHSRSACSNLYRKRTSKSSPNPWAMSNLQQYDLHIPTSTLSYPMKARRYQQCTTFRQICHQARQNVRCKGFRAGCFALKPSSLASVKACQGNVAVCQEGKVPSPDIVAFRTAVPFWEKPTCNLSGLPPKRDCSPKRVNTTPRRPNFNSVLVLHFNY